MSKSRKDSNDLSSMVSILQDRVLALEGALRRFRQNENAARESERLFRSTFDAVPDLIAILGMDHEIVRVNRAMAERLGTTPADCIGMKCYTVVHGTDSPPSFCPHARVLKTGQEETVEVREDNLKGDFLVTCSPLHDLDGTLIGSVHVALDITERKRAQRALERDDALLRSIREAQSLYIEGADPKQVFSRLLDVLVSMTQSQYGFLDEVVNDDQGNSYKRSLALSNIAWDEGSRGLYEQLVGSNMEFRNLQNLAGAPALTRGLVIANDVPHDPRSGGLPDGHPPLNSFMGIPMYYGGELVGVAGVANRPGGYDERLAEVLEPFVMTCASIISAVRNERKERMLAESRRASETRFQDIVHNVADLIWEVDEGLAFTYCSEHVQEVLGFAVDEMIGRTLFDFISPEDRAVQKAAFEQVMARRGTFRDREVALLRKDGRRLIFQISGVPILGQDGTLLGYRGVNRDVTQAKWTQKEKELTIELFELLASKTDLHDLMARVTGVLSRWSGCQAVGIRLKQGDDYPYFETRGFPREFALLENRLCAVDPAGEAIRDSKGDPVLECMCGNIIYGRFDPSLPFFTPHGSFWTNCTTELLATTTEEQRQARTRNRCNGMGYESVALIPLRAGRTPLGLLQLNDKRKGRFTLELIELLERQATRIALAIAQRQAEENLRRSETALRAILNSATDTAVLVDSDYRFVACNETAAARVGMSPEVMVGREMLSFFPPEVTSRRKAFLDQVRATRQPVRFVDERAGLVLDNSYHPVLDQNGDVSRIAIFARDITEQRKAEESLRQSQEQFQETSQLLTTVLENTYMMAAYLDTQFNFIWVNKAYATTCGHEPAFFPGKNHFDLYPHAENQAIFQRVVDTGEPFLASAKPFTFPDQPERGVTYWDWSLFPVKTGAGKLVGLVFTLADVTDRIRAQQSLRESEEKYRRLVETATEGVWAMDAERRTTFVNQRMAESLGLTIDDMVGRQVTDFMFPEDLPAHQDRMKERREGHEGRYEQRFRKSDGSVVWCLVSARPLKDDQGRFVGSFGMFTDITERKRAEEALRAEQNNLKAVFEAAPIGMALFDGGCRIVSANQELARILHRDVSEILRLRCGEVLGCVHDAEVLEGCGHSPSCSACGIMNAITGGLTEGTSTQGAETEITLIRHGTEVRQWLRFSVEPIELEGRGHIVLAVADVTDRKQAEESLRRSEERLRLAMKATNDVVWDWDIIHDLQQWNEAGIPVFGWSDIVEHPQTAAWWTDRVHPEDHERVSQTFHAAVQDPSQNHWQDEYRFRKGNGDYAVVLDRGYIMRDEQGRAVRMIGAMLDLTERKRAEEDLQRSLRRFELLTRTAETLLRTDQPQEMVETLCRQVMDLLDCQAFFNFLADDVAGCLHLNACAGIPPEEAKKIEWLEYGVAVCGCAARDACRIVAEHIPSTADPRTDLVKSYGIKAYACHPLLGGGGKVMGTLSFGTRNRETFSEDDLSLMKAVADQVAMAMMRVESQKSVYESEQRHRYLFENMLNGLAYCRMLFEDGRPVDFVYLAVNNAFETLTGLKDVVGKRVSEVIPGIRESDPGLLEAYGRVALTGKAERFEAYVKVLDMWFSLSVYSPRKEHFVTAFDVITERKRSEERLRRTGERLHMAQLAAGAGAWDWDITTGRLEWTPEFFTLFGLDSKVHTASFETWRTVVHPEDVETASQRVEEAIQDKQPLLNEYRIVRPDGTVRWISAFGDTTYDDAGHPLRMAGICIDTTDRKGAEESVRRSEEKYRTLVDQAADAIFLHDLSGRILDVNRKACENLGYTREELLSKFIADIDPEAIQARHHQSWGQIPLGQQVRFESRQKRKDGSFFPVEVILGSVDLPSGQAVLGVVRDITDRKLAEEILRESEERYRSLVQSSPDVVYTYSNKRGGLFYSPRIEEVLGYSVEHLLAHPFLWNESIHPEDHQKIREAIAARSGDAPFDVEYRIRDAAGNWRWFRDRSIRRRREGDETITDGLATDITDRKRAEEALRESEKRFRGYFELPLVGIAITSPEKGWVEVNDRLCDMLGYSRGELTRMTWAELTHPDDLMPDVVQFERLLAGEIDGYEMDKRFIRKGGHSVWTRLAVRSVREQDGRVGYLVALLQDITDRKLAEEALSKSEEAARAILDASTAAVTLLDRRGTILDCNEEQASRFHLRREETLGRCIWDLLPSPLADQRKGLVDRVFQTGRMHRTEDERKGMWNDVVVYPLIGDAGGVERVAMHAMNITDRKRAELALRRASLYSRNLLETSLDPLVTISAEGKITDVNTATEKVTGVGRDKLIGSDFADYFTDPVMARAGYRKAFVEGQVIDYPLAVRHASGGTTDVLYNASVYRNEKGTVLGVFAAARDITERKRAEDALRGSLAEKEVLLREIHHRVKNNLAAIAALLEIQRKTVSDAAATDALNDLASRIQSMSLVHERLYRSENISRIDLKEYVEALVSHIRTSFGSRANLRCEVRASGVEMGLDAAIPCGLIINELVTNAIKYAFPDGKPCGGATDCRIEVSASQAGAAYTLVVADNGVGLPPDLDWTTTSSLGLRLVRMVGQHQLGGHMELDRSAGTRFTLTFGSDRAG